MKGGREEEEGEGEGREKDGRGGEGKWRSLLISEGRGGEGKREREGPPVITVSPGSRGARIVTAPRWWEGRLAAPPQNPTPAIGPSGHASSVPHCKISSDTAVISN